MGGYCSGSCFDVVRIPAVPAANQNTSVCRVSHSVHRLLEAVDGGCDVPWSVVSSCCTWQPKQKKSTILYLILVPSSQCVERSVRGLATGQKSFSWWGVDSPFYRTPKILLQPRLVITYALLFTLN